MSRGSSPLYGSSPLNPGEIQIQTCLNLSVSSSGLSGLAKGYEQYRESLTSLRPTTEYGEPSSDDLSSEWESSSEMINEQLSIVTLKEPLATNLALNAVRRRKMIPSSHNELDGKNGEKGQNEEDIKNNTVKASSHKRVRMIQYLEI